jgi:hypothetical protein
MDRERVSKIICGPSRLWDAEAESTYPYTLSEYTPGYIKITVGGTDAETMRGLIWAEYNDGLWVLKINGKDSNFQASQANLRAFYAKPGDIVEMTYRGPLTRLWR